MANTKYSRADEGVPQGFMRISEAYRLLHASEAPAVPINGPDARGGSVESQASALLGAKAAVAAFCLESYAALCVYIAWEFIRLYR